mmetsp:Transcript_41146/g.60925  ORF Transcript_41146/g.60925 Transcript_41146/m.60925 type:complete len:210 (-) Transcript_41146:922-1551(-)
MADRSKYIECYEHFVEVVLVRNMTDDMVKSLKHDGCDDIEKLGMMDSSSVGRLKLINNSGAEVPLNNSDKQLLRVVLLFFTLEDKADVYNHATFMALTAKDWQDFNRAQRLAARSTGTSGSSSTTGSTTGTPAPSASGSSFKPVDSFKRGIKRDTSAFPTLNDENNQDQWHQDMQVQACAQGVDNVLDATYTPASTKETELFAEKNKFV